MREQVIRWINQHPGNEIVQEHFRELDETIKKLKKELEDANKLKEDSFNLADRFHREITTAQSEAKELAEKTRHAEESAKKAGDALIQKIDQNYQLQQQLGKTVGELDNAKNEAKACKKEVARLESELSLANGKHASVVKQNQEICDFVLKRRV